MKLLNMQKIKFSYEFFLINKNKNNKKNNSPRIIK